MESLGPPIPDLRLQPPAVDFIENYMDDDPAYATPPSHYDPDLRKFIIDEQQAYPTWPMAPTQAEPVSGATEPSYQAPPRPLADPEAALKFWDTLFDPAMEEFKATHGSEPKEIVEKRCSIRDKSNWIGVFDQLETVKQGYCNVDKGFQARFRKGYRKFADHGVNTLLCATKFVPNVDYVTPVLGAVQILLEAMKSASKARTEIVGAVDDIDVRFSEVEMYLEDFPGDENIKKASVDLIATVFYAVECAIGFFLKSTWKRALSATFTAEEYQAKARDGLSSIDSQSAKLIHEAMISDRHLVRSNMNEILSRTHHWKSDFRRIHHGQAQLRQGQMLILRGQRVQGHDLKNSFFALIDGLEKSMCQIQHLTEVIERSRPSTPLSSTSPPPYLKPQELLDWIGIPDLASDDLEYCNERRNTRVPENEQASAERIVEHWQFQEWLVCPTSSQLLIHGNFEGMPYLSGLSLFCTSFIEALAQRAPKFLHVTFFCGLHEDSSADEHVGGRAMIESFICQLLCQYDFSAAILAPDVGEQLFRHGDIEDLCRLFKLLAYQLPEGTVLVCVIDGIVYYEREWFLDDMSFVLATILEMSDEGDTHACVKVLITSPTKTTEARLPFPDDLILSMEAMPRCELVASRLRLERQLGGGFNDGVEDWGY